MRLALALVVLSLLTAGILFRHIAVLKSEQNSLLEEMAVLRGDSHPTSLDLLIESIEASDVMALGDPNLELATWIESVEDTGLLKNSEYSTTSRARAHMTLAKLLLSISDPKRALDHFDAALDLADVSSESARAVRRERVVAMRQCGRTDEALHELRDLVAFWRRNSDHERVSWGLLEMARVHRQRGALETAEDLLDEALSLPIAESGANGAATAETSQELASLLHQTGDLQESEELWRDCLEHHRGVLGSGLQVAECLCGLGALLMDQSRAEEARDHVEEALGIWEGRLGSQHSRVASTLEMLGELDLRSGGFEMASTRFQRALSILEDKGPPIRTADVMVGLGRAEQSLGRPTKAESYFRDALLIYEQNQGSSVVRVADALSWLGGLLVEGGEFEAALDSLRKAEQMRAEALGQNHPKYAASLNNLAVALSRLSRLEEAIELQHRAVDVTIAAFGHDHENVAVQTENLGVLLHAAGRRDEAIAEFARCVTIRRSSATNADRLLLAETLGKLGRLQRRGARLQEARASLSEALDLFDAEFEDDDPRIRELVPELAATMKGEDPLDILQLYVDHSFFAEAEPVARNHLDEIIGGEEERVRKARTLLGACLIGLQKFDQAEEVLVESYLEWGDSTQATATHRLSVIVHLYESWRKPEEAESWRFELDERGR